MMRGLFLMLILVALPICLPTQAFSDDSEEKFPFDKRGYYDIYIDTGDRLNTVIENVRLIRFEEISGKEFLIIESSAFKLQEQSGYVLFDSILAVLPRDNFRVHTVPSLKTNKIIYSQ